MNKFFIGIDLGGTRVKIGMVANGAVIARSIVPAYSANGLASYLPVLQQEIDSLIAAHAPANAALHGIGLAFPGVVDTTRKQILQTNKKYDDATALDLNNWVQATWKVPFFMDNDARMATAGEWKYGAGKGYDDLVMMTMGTGIGTSAVIEGKLLRGKHFQAGCLGGHVSIQYQGTRCICGNTGCVEVYGGSWNLPTLIKEHPLYAGSALYQAPLLDFRAVFDAAAAGDSLAVLIRKQCMDAWAAGIIHLIHAYDPELVLLGGGVLHSADVILPYIRKQVQQQAWCPWGIISIEPSELAEDAAILGIVHCLEESYYLIGK
ncbi:MAG: ROK family protein [Chitinophagaceae bacterium]